MFTNNNFNFWNLRSLSSVFITNTNVKNQQHEILLGQFVNLKSQWKILSFQQESFMDGIKNLQNSYIGQECALRALETELEECVEEIELRLTKEKDREAEAGLGLYLLTMYLFILNLVVGRELDTLLKTKGLYHSGHRYPRGPKTSPKKKVRFKDLD